jgi:hypothetical protein
VGADGEGKADEGEDEGGHGLGEALVPLHAEGHGARGVVAEGRDALVQLAEREILLRFLQPRRPLKPLLERQAHVVGAEHGVPIADGGHRAARRRPRGPVGPCHVSLVDGPLQETEGETAVLVVRDEPSLAGRDDPGQLGVALVGHEYPPQRGGRHDLLHVDGHVAERRVEHALLQPAHRARLEDAEELTLKLAVGDGPHHEREHGRRQGRGHGRHQDRLKEADHAHARRLERGDLEVTGQTAAREEDRDEERHGKGEGEERRQHVDEELEHQLKGHALRDHEVGELIDAIDEEEEREEDEAEPERCRELAEEVPIEHAHHAGPHRPCCTIGP